MSPPASLKNSVANPLILVFPTFSSILRSVDLSTSHDSKQFQELLLERTKALAAQTEAIKSSNSEGKRGFDTCMVVRCKQSQTNQIKSEFDKGSCRGVTLGRMINFTIF